MREHGHEHDDLDVESTATRRKEALDPSVMKAVNAGRPDVVGTSGMLGLQRRAGNQAASTVAEEESSSVHDVVSSGGAPLDDDVRVDMETRMGHDFSDVRVHTGDEADTSARSVSANAYTVGSNIVFQRGSYEPGSEDGQRLLAHELTHVVQQRSGPVDGTPMPGGISVSDPSDRFEREAAANADAVMAQPVQRDAAPEEEEEMQTALDPSLGQVQRQEGDEQEEEELPT